MFVPVTVRVNCAPPAVAEVGLRVVIVGVGALTTAKASELETLPPALFAVMLSVLVVRRSLAGITAVSWVALTNVVESAVPFQFTVAPERKFVPVTVRV
jgi:hypothetical protein